VTLVKGPGFVGVIFPANTKTIPGELYPKGASDWTPSESDVRTAEKGLIPFFEVIEKSAGTGNSE
jgi:hypothetical protein